MARWLDNPQETAGDHALSDLGHIRVRGRATLVDITWNMGGTNVVCTLDEMVEYIPGGSRSAKDVPDCHHIFERRGDATIAAEVRYQIEQQVSIRRYLTTPFPDTPWEPHPIDQFVTVPSDPVDLAVSEIYSVNVPLDQAPDEELATTAQITGD